MNRDRMTRTRTRTVLTLAALVMAALVLPAAGKEIPEQLPDPDNKPPDTTKPVKVFFLSGQSNMCGMGRPESLKPLAMGNEKFAYLVDDNGNWTRRNDVYYIYYVMDKRAKDGQLTVFNRIGPELGIGHVLGHCYDEVVLLIKGACGNRSLGWDFMPPTSRKRLGKSSADGGWYAGTSYDRYVKHAKNVLANLKDNLPGYKGQGYEMAGFFWWQGHKDKGMAKKKYLRLLAELIHDLRADFKAPHAMFVVATVGFNGRNLGPWQGVFDAQMAISQQPMFIGNVASVDIRDMGGGGYHYGNNGATYAKVGDEMGRAMAAMVGSTKGSDTPDVGPLPEGLDEKTISRSLLPALKVLSHRNYWAVEPLLDRLEKANQQRQAKPNADQAILQAELKDIQTIRTFVDEQVTGAFERIKSYVSAGNLYRANQLVIEYNRYFRGIEKYETPVAKLQKAFLQDPYKTAIQQGAQFYQLLANAQRVRTPRTIDLLAKFAENVGDTAYGKAANAAVAALNKDPKVELDGDTLVAGEP